MQSVSFSEHEAFDHPVACNLRNLPFLKILQSLLVVSSKDERPINKFVELFNTDNLPSLLSDGSMDPKILKHYLILHDNQDGVADRATNILSEMRGTFGSNSCKLLCINSADDGNSDCKDIQWVPYGNHALLSDDVDRFLTTVDLSAVKDFMQDLCCNHLIPHMEQKIRILNQQVSATRKGFKNQIKNLWWRKGKDDTPETSSGSAYVFSSIESQIRVLGDYAFMLRDYELALSNYRLLSTDYKLDKAWKRYAGVQEMSGLSYFMLDQSRKEAEYCMENAFTTYLKLGSSGQRNAARCGLWWAEMLKDRGQFRDAASIYSRIAVEEPSLHAAIMFEQASYCYLFSLPTMLRKYGFYLVLAGNRYYISNERQHAIRAYKSALLVYKEKGWNYIADHVHINIGRWYAYLGIFEVAVKHMLEVLACSHQSVGTQRLFLNDFFHVVKSTGKRFEVHKLQLPVIDMMSLKVMYQDHRTYSSSSDQVLVSESLWQSLEEEMVPSVPMIKSNWLDAEPRTSSLKKYKDYCICVAGEIIKVDLEFKNPLQVPISVSGVSLICELSARSETGKADSEASSFEEDKEFAKHPSLKDLPDDDSHFIVAKLDIVLQGLETKKLQLEVSPKVEGMLTIVGVKWTLSESVVGYEYFEFAAKRKQKKKKQDLRSSNRALHFVVIKELPKLEGYIHNLPSKLLVGDLRHLELELRNPSKHPVKNVKMKISHPRFLIPGSTGDKIIDFPDCLNKQRSSESKDISADHILNYKSLLFAFPNNTTVQGESTLTWPLWLHASISGKITLYLSIYYEVQSSSSSMTYRVLRMRHDIEVVPALDVSFLVTPCFSRLQEFAVRMDILNRTVSSNIHLSQLSCLGDHWQISASASNFPSQTLNSGQAMSCFFKLKSCRNDPNSENLLHFQVSNLIIGSDDSKDLLVDVSKSPVAEFHQYERCHQGKSGKVDSGIVDFILMSRLYEKNSLDEPRTPDILLSNHTCHCSITSKAPISWLTDGPRMINHDFSASFCEASILLKIHNWSDAVVVIRVNTFDDIPAGNQPAGSDSFGSDGVWHDISLGDDLKAISSVQGSWPKKSATVGAASPFVWSSTSSTKLKLEPSCAVEVPLKVCIFSPGTYDISNYELQWRLKPSDDDSQASEVKKCTSGSSRGHSFYLTVLQAPH